MSANILVTGAAGFIGSNFVRYWCEHYPAAKIIAYDSLTYAGNLANISDLTEAKNLSFVKGDILDQGLVEKLLSENDISTLVHFAAESHVDRSITGPDAFIDTNVCGTHSLLKAAKRVWLDAGSLFENHRFHHVSTDEVYGTLGSGDEPFKETTPYAPNSPYAASKAASDHLVRAYHHTYGLKVTTSNCSNNYGPYHFPEKLIPLVITNILFDKALPIYGDGQQIRDWLYVDDHVRGIEKVLSKGCIGETYNIGGENEWANIDIVKLICGLLNKKFSESEALKERYPLATSAHAGDSESLISYVKDRPGHDRRYAIDPTRAQNEIDYRPKETFDSGIEKTVDWYLENSDWWEAVMDGSYQQWMETQYQL